MYIAAIFNDYSSCNTAFSDGIASLESLNVAHAEQCFKMALAHVDDKHPNYRRYISYFGMARVLMGKYEEIQFCRKAVSGDAQDGDLYLNLARMEWFLQNRSNTVKALQEGLRRDPGHEGLVLMWSRIGQRKRKPVFFLPRGNLVNKMIGCVLRGQA